jgi:hypothetical protein
MTRKTIIEHTVKVINQLPTEKAEEISDFADDLFKKYEEETLTKGIQQITTDGASFNFLEEDEPIYTTSDLKIRYNG